MTTRRTRRRKSRLNPRRAPRRRVHTAAFDRCVVDVRKKAGAVNPYAVCTASMGGRGISPKHRRRRANPIRRTGRPRRQYLIAARKPGRGGSGLGFAGDRFTTRSAEWVKFPSQILARRFARHLKMSYKALRGWRLAVIALR